mmetsp:Transcript_69912/g.202633  ORF Transcript_69912/g.202633 Transcript_69912/m.202633 type:complete len:344 (-) Transcript_69912:701-1732(-)
MKHRTNWIVLCVSLLLKDVVAFGVNVVSRPKILPAGRSLATKCPSKKNDDASGGLGNIDDALRQLEQLVSSESDSENDQRKDLDDWSAYEVQDINLSIQGEDGPETSMMSETALFKDMLSEFSETSETDMIANLKNELSISTSTNTDFDASRSETEIFMEIALDQALKQAEIEAQMGIDKESLLENKEIMNEIALIFERANAELMEGIEEIRRQQMALAVENAVRNAKLSQDRIDDNQERLAAAEENMRKMLAKVNQETRNVEAAIEDLKRAQVDLQGGVDDKLMNLKRGGFAKQAALVGALLFGLRSIVETVAFVGGDAVHLIPAMFQGTIAVVCFVAFIVI